MVLPLDNKAQVAVSIGSKIRALRQRLKRTLDEVATTAGISKPFLSQVERGHATPSITSLVGIARALGVTVQYFVDTPTEGKSVQRGSELRYFGFDGTANLFGRLTLEGTTFVLQAGDTAHYESTVPHAWCNTAREEAVVVWVGTPRLF
jgi:transcriptional regulator with XRE-family HTH domain